MDTNQLARFLSKVDKTDHQRCQDHGCWIWTAGTRKNYGQLRVGTTMVLAHRLSYEHYVGDIPEGMVIRHMCPFERGDLSNRRCVNPDHLEVGTQKENVLEGYGNSAQNAQKTHCPKCGGEYSIQQKGKQRRCRPCTNERQRNRRQRKKEQQCME